jgi:hypothetical protein
MRNDIIIALKHLIITINPYYVSDSTSGKYIHSIEPTVSSKTNWKIFIKIAELNPLNTIIINRHITDAAYPTYRILILLNL